MKQIKDARKLAIVHKIKKSNVITPLNKSKTKPANKNKKSEIPGDNNLNAIELAINIGKVYKPDNYKKIPII